jgi:nucleoside-diphosphate-sugar epimerase
MSTTPQTPKKTILFLGATGGVGLSALRRSLAAGHTCIALCRTPANLTAQLNNTTTPSNLHIIGGNAHSVADLHTCFTHPSTVSSGGVDIIVSSIGARPTLRGMSDAHVCGKGMQALLEALRKQREEGNGNGDGDGKAVKVPRLVVVSTTGISDVARDVPLLVTGLYKVLLHTPHTDKKKMEKMVREAGKAGEVEWTIVRGSLYTNGPATEGLVRVGVEDPVKGVLEKEALGYTISREDVGKWVFDECLDKEGREWVGKAAILTY